MSDSVEVVIPGLASRRHAFKGLPSAARVVAAPSERPMDRIVVAPLAVLGDTVAVDLIARIRAARTDVPVILYASREGPHGFEEIARLQNLAIASSRPSESAFVAPDEETVARIVRAHLAGAQKLLIATARIEAGHFLVWSCEPRLYRCEVSALAPLRDLPASTLGRFEVTRSGSRLRWPDADVDLALESIRAASDPAFRVEQNRRYRRAARGYGKAIRRLRRKHGLAQSGIEGLSDREVRRIEHGERIPHASTLEKLARAHGISLDLYMGELARITGAGARGSGEREASENGRSGASSAWEPE